MADSILRESANWTLHENETGEQAANVRSLHASREPATPRSSEGASLSRTATILGPKCRLKGEFIFNEAAELQGFVEGKIVAETQLVIGPTAEIRADIRAESVAILGRVIGDIRASDLLELKAGARISGNIAAPRVIMHDGVQFDGSCRMGEALEE